MESTPKTLCDVEGIAIDKYGILVVRDLDYYSRCMTVP
jgi:hypothetical protein